MDIREATPAEFDKAMALMRRNMQCQLERRGIPWDEEWNRANFENRDNFSVLCGERWTGFVALECLPDSLFVHTVQLIPEVQGSIHGVRILAWIRQTALKRGKRVIRCRALAGSPVVGLYQRLGFSIDGQGSRLVDLSLDVESGCEWL